MNDSEQLILLYEEITLRRTGPKTVSREDISNFLFKVTDGGREMCTLYTIRKNDSRTDPSKKAGMPMAVTGRLGTCKATLAASEVRVPELDTKVQYQKNKILRLCVTSVDGEGYVRAYPPEARTRSFDVTNINKIEAGGETYIVV